MACGPNGLQHPLIFLHGQPATRGGQPVITSPFIVQLGVGALINFDDQARSQQPLDRAIQRARSKFEAAGGLCLHILHNGVAMLIPIC